MLSLEGLPACLDYGPELPLVENFVFSLKKCRETKDLECTNHVHTIIYSHGLESNNVLGNHLVPIYVECGSVAVAHQVFHKLEEQNEHSWTSLIQGNVDCGKFEHALDMFQEMQHSCVQPSKFTFHSILRAYSSLRYMNGARQVHLDITKKGLEMDPFVGVSLVDVYAKCGSLVDANSVCYQLPIRNEAIWNTLIAAFSEQGQLNEVLNCFEHMQCDGVAPDVIMFAHPLKACINVGWINKGQEVHAEIAQEEFDGDLFLGNTLVDMYVKASLLDEARAVLDDLPVRDVVTWTTLMAGYAEQGLGAEVLSCFGEMLSDGITPNDVTYVCALKACGSIGAIAKGQDLHLEIATEGFENLISVATSVVDMYAKCGFLAEAWEVLKEAPARDLVSWNVIIAAYAESDDSEEAFSCFGQMQADGVAANAATYSSLLKSCCSIGCLEKARKLHNDVVIEGLEADPFVCCALVDVFAKCGSLMEEAEDIFHDLAVRNVAAWTALISGYVDHGLLKRAMDSANQMWFEGILPNSATFVCTLKVCSALEAIEEGEALHICTVKLGLNFIPFVSCSLIDMYMNCGLLAEAQGVFDDLLERDTASWNALLSGYAKHGYADEVLNLMRQMEFDGVPLDASTYLSGLKVCGISQIPGGGRILHMEIVKKGFHVPPFVKNTLVDMYAKCGLLAEAKSVFDDMSSHDVISWNALIVGFIECKLFEEALICMEKFQHDSVHGDITTFVYFIKTCSCTGAIGKGQELHAELVKIGIEDDLSVCKSLLDMYVNCGTLEEAQEIHVGLSLQDVVSWNILIGGYIEQMRGEEALIQLEEMYSGGISPNDVTYIAALKACSIVEDLTRAKVFHAEVSKGGFESDLLVGRALVDMYGRLGLVGEAEYVFDSLSPGDVVLCNAMLAGYVQNGYEQEALILLEQIEEEGISPDLITFDFSLKACRNLRDLESGHKLYLDINKKGLEEDVSLANNFLHLYIYCGILGDACELLSRLTLQGAVSWDALVAVYGRHGLHDELLHALDIALLEEVILSPFMVVCGLKACGNVRAAGKGQKLHAEVIKEMLEADTHVSNILVHMYAKCGLLAEAQETFDNMEAQDVVSWTSLIAGFVEHGLFQEALSCLEEMQLAGVFANAFTFACSVKACNNLGALRKGLQIHAEIVQEGYETEPYVCSGLVDMYSKCGSIIDAQDVFETVAFGDIVPWNMMITNYAEQGFSEGAFDCLEQMLLDGLSPNAVTYVCSLKACSSVGAVEKGWELHTEIVIEGYEQDMYVGNILVDMYAKCGALLEALESFGELSAKNIVSWTALISGCASQGQSELSCSFFDTMVQTGLRPDGITLLSVLTTCSHAGFVEKGFTYFDTFSRHEGIMLSVDHYNCIVDLLSRAGQLKECLSVIETMPCEPDHVTWRTMMGACRKWGNVELGERAFKRAVQVDGMQIAACILMYNIYADAGMWEDARKLDVLIGNIQGRQQMGTNE